MGNTLAEQKKLEEALDAYDRALNINPNYYEAYKNSLKLLKCYYPKKPKNHLLFVTNNKVKKNCYKLISSEEDCEIADILINAFDNMAEDRFFYRTPSSQIFKYNSKDLNCNRHMDIFETKNIIPEFCFGCFKVQTEVNNFFDLIRLTKLFYNFKVLDDLIAKTMIELRPNISGFYKGYIYCKNLKQATKVKKILDINLKIKLKNKVKSQVKRGCSEFALEYPEYANINGNDNKIMDYPIEWKNEEIQFDQKNFIRQQNDMPKSINGFCLEDLYIIQKWIDYGKGIKDKTCEQFENRPIIFDNIYKIANNRKK